MQENNNNRTDEKEAPSEFDVSKLLSGSFLAFNPILTLLGVGINAALFLAHAIQFSQLKAVVEQGGWFYRTRTDLEGATGLSIKEQLTAREKLKSISVISERKAGCPPKIWFRVNVDQLGERLISVLKSSDSPVALQRKNLIAKAVKRSQLCPSGTFNCADRAHSIVPVGNNSLTINNKLNNKKLLTDELKDMLLAFGISKRAIERDAASLKKLVDEEVVGREVEEAFQRIGDKSVNPLYVLKTISSIRHDRQSKKPRSGNVISLDQAMKYQTDLAHAGGWLDD